MIYLFYMFWYAYIFHISDISLLFLKYIIFLSLLYFHITLTVLIYPFLYLRQVLICLWYRFCCSSEYNFSFHPFRSSVHAVCLMKRIYAALVIFSCFDFKYYLRSFHFETFISFLISYVFRYISDPEIFCGILTTRGPFVIPVSVFSSVPDVFIIFESYIRTYTILLIFQKRNKKISFLSSSSLPSHFCQYIFALGIM